MKTWTTLHLLLLCTLIGSLVPTAHAAEGKRPNILFIIADDQSPFDFKFYNPKSKLQTPVIDQLAADGMVFDAAYHMGSWSGAVCTPSRHMVMSGRSVWHIPSKARRKTNPNEAKSDLVPPDLANFTMAAVFNRAGYDTMRTCKTGNSYAAANKQFTIVHEAMKRGGTPQTGSAWHGKRVLEYLDEREKNNDTDPFLIYFGFSHPHDTRDGTPKLLAKYGATNHADKDSLPAGNPKQPQLPANWLPTHPFENSHLNVRDEVNVSGVWKNRDEDTIRNELGRDYACSENIDNQVGRLLKKLEAMGELDNTYVFYTADHGMAIGRHGLQGKQNLYEHTWRVPLVVKGPGIEPGSRAPGNVYLMDVLATMCDLTGVESPETNEGISFKPVLEGKQKTIRDVLYGVYSGGQKPGMRSVRQGDWKLVKYDVPNAGVHETQLFNLAENPLELLPEHHEKEVIAVTGYTPKANETNLADKPEYAAKRKELETLLQQEMGRLDDPFKLWDQN